MDFQPNIATIAATDLNQPMLESGRRYRTATR
jgi:hypothetical protein